MTVLLYVSHSSTPQGEFSTSISKSAYFNSNIRTYLGQSNLQKLLLATLVPMACSDFAEENTWVPKVPLLRA